MRDNQKTVTAPMIEAAVMAEFEHYHPGRKMNEFAWQSTPRIVIKKMIEAAVLAERARCASICRDAPFHEGKWLANEIEGIEDDD
jgi:hypothetical protein